MSLSTASHDAESVLLMSAISIDSMSLSHQSSPTTDDDSCS
jgi:hypothetical protein